jgi:hypothetical protein
MQIAVNFPGAWRLEVSPTKKLIILSNVGTVAHYNVLWAV